METAILRRFEHKGAKKILFCGDDDLDRAALYLAAVTAEEGYGLVYVPSTLPFPPELRPEDFDLVILSDYPRSQIADARLHDIRNALLDGGALLMIGGWESFYGLNGEYHDSPLAPVLPVRMRDRDDRVNYDQGIAVLPAEGSPFASAGLDWRRPPLIGGYNAFSPKEDSEVHLYGKELHIAAEGSVLRVRAAGEDIPLFVTGPAGKGYAGALAFDLAPHWIGGMVDWGKKREHVDLEANFIEVGDMYYRFVSRLLKMMTTNSEGINKRSERL